MKLENCGQMMPWEKKRIFREKVFICIGLWFVKTLIITLTTLIFRYFYEVDEDAVDLIKSIADFIKSIVSFTLIVSFVLNIVAVFIAALKTEKILFFPIVTALLDFVSTLVFMCIVSKGLMEQVTSVFGNDIVVFYFAFAMLIAAFPAIFSFVISLAESAIAMQIVKKLKSKDMQPPTEESEIRETQPLADNYQVEKQKSKNKKFWFGVLTCVGLYIARFIVCGVIYSSLIRLGVISSDTSPVRELDAGDILLFVLLILTNIAAIVVSLCLKNHFMMYPVVSLMFGAVSGVALLSGVAVVSVFLSLVINPMFTLPFFIGAAVLSNLTILGINSLISFIASKIINKIRERKIYNDQTHT